MNTPHRRAPHIEGEVHEHHPACHAPAATCTCQDEWRTAERDQISEWLETQQIGATYLVHTHGEPPLTIGEYWSMMIQRREHERG